MLKEKENSHWQWGCKQQCHWHIESKQCWELKTMSVGKNRWSKKKCCNLTFCAQKDLNQTTNHVHSAVFNTMPDISNTNIKTQTSETWHMPQCEEMKQEIKNDDWDKQRTRQAKTMKENKSNPWWTCQQQEQNSFLLTMHASSLHHAKTVIFDKTIFLVHHQDKIVFHGNQMDLSNHNKICLSHIWIFFLPTMGITQS